MSVAPSQPITAFRGEIFAITLTATGVDLTTAAEVTMLVRDSSGATVATYTTASEVTVDSATQATITTDLTSIAVDEHVYEVWVDLTGGNRRIIVAPSRLTVRAVGRYP